MIGPLIAAGATLLSGYLNNRAADNRQEDQQAFNAEQFATRYQTTVKDMQAAGLNPMLAYSQGGGAGASSGIASSGGYGDLGSTLTQAKLASAQVANIQADTENKKVQSDNINADTALKRAQMYLTTAQEGLAGASADQSRANVSYLEAQARKVAEEVKNVPKEGDRLEALVKNLSEEYKLIVERTHNTTQATEQLKWLTVKAMVEGDLLNLDLKAANDIGNLGRFSKEFKTVIDVLRLFRGK